MADERTEESRQTERDYAEYLEEAFQGEVYGEALFRTMGDLCEDPVRARKLRILEQLERETKEFLLPALRAAGADGAERSERVADGEKLGAGLANAPWADLLRGFVNELQRFVEEFERAEALAPPGEEGVVKHVTAHERALLHFASRELEEPDASDSLDPVISLLRTPPAA